jgi:hypothetical protein
MIYRTQGDHADHYSTSLNRNGQRDRLECSRSWVQTSGVMVSMIALSVVDHGFRLVE